MSRSRPAIWTWSVCLVLGLATFLNYMDRQALAVTLPELKKEHHLAESRIGRLEGGFGFAFAAGCLVFGFLADRLGPHKLYPAVLFGWSAAGIATSFAGSPTLINALETPDDTEGTGLFRWLFLCRVALGFFEAGHWPCALLTVKRILTDRDRALGNGILQSGASLGAILIPIYVMAVERLGFRWPFVFWSVGVVGLLWIPLWFLLVKNEDVQPQHHTDSERCIAIISISNIIKHVIVLAVIVCTINISWQFLRAWLALFLQDFHHYSKDATRLCTSLYFISTDIGCLAAGFVVKLLLTRGCSVRRARQLGFTLFAAMTALAALLPLTDGGIVTIASLMLAGAGILGLHPFYYALVQDLPGRLMATLSGALAALGWVVSSLFQIVIGSVIQEHKNYDVGLVLVGLLPLLGVLALWIVPVNMTNTKSGS